MKKTNNENIEISEIIGKILNVRFENTEFSLGKWGDVDNWCRVSKNELYLIEYEKSQKHPNTNVLKLYPYLEENPNISLTLIHYFYPENKAPKNRIALCDFLGNKMNSEFGYRFKYFKLMCEKTKIKRELNKLLN